MGMSLKAFAVSLVSLSSLVAAAGPSFCGPDEIRTAEGVQVAVANDGTVNVTSAGKAEEVTLVWRRKHAPETRYFRNDWERTYCSKFSLVEDKQGGLFGEYNQNLLDIQFYQGQNTLYAVELRYPMYAAEGFGAELQVMRDTFQRTN